MQSIIDTAPITMSQPSHRHTRGLWVVCAVLFILLLSLGIWGWNTKRTNDARLSQLYSEQQQGLKSTQDKLSDQLAVLDGQVSTNNLMVSGDQTTTGNSQVDGTASADTAKAKTFQGGHYLGNGSGLTNIHADTSGTATSATNAANAGHAGSADTATNAKNADLLDGQHGSYYQNATNINTGTLGDNRLSNNVALQNADNAMAGNNTFSGNTSMTNLSATNINTGTLSANNLTTTSTTSGSLTVSGSTSLGTTTTGDLVTTGTTSLGGVVYTWPGVQSNGVLTNDGSGNLAWQPVGACASCITTGGNALGSSIIIGTNDPQNLVFRTNSTDYLTLATNGNATLNGNFTANALIGNGASVSNVNAAQLNGNTAGNSSGQIALNNGTLNTNLNADLLDGQHGSYYQNANNLNAGTLSDSRLSSNVTLQGNSFNGASQLVMLAPTGFLPSLNGSALTSLNAAQLTTGTVADARLSSNVPLKNTTNTFTATNNFAGVTATGILQNGYQVCDVSNNCSYAPTSGGANYIQNSTSAQTANMNITGTGVVAGGLKAPSLDTAVAGVLTLGGTNATGITLAQNTTLAAGKSITITGGNTASRPTSPTAGMVYYDTTTNQLLTYAGSKWQTDRSTANFIVAAGGSSQANKDKADFVGDGTNDQNAINAAIAALPAGGGSVVLLDGTYNIAAAVRINKNNVSLTGQGGSTVLKRMYDSVSSQEGVVTVVSGYSNDSISGLYINGNKVSYTAAYNAGILYGDIPAGCGSSNTNISITNNFIINTGGNGITSGGTTCNGLRGNFIANNTVQSADGGGIAVRSYAKTIIQNNTVESSNVTGITLGGNTSSANGNLVLSNYVYGGRSTAGSAVSGSIVDGNTIVNNMNIGVEPGSVVTNNYICNNTQSAIFRREMAVKIISGNEICNNGAGIGGSGASFSIQTISNNYIHDNTGTAIAYSSNYPTTISDNSMVNNGSTGSNGSIAIVMRAGGSIIDNTITDTAGTGCAIALNSGSVGVALSGNMFSGPGANCILDSGTDTTYANQQDGNGNLITRGQAGVGINTTSPTASLQNAGAFVQGGLAAPATPTVTVNGVAGTTTWGYKITATDGLGETLASTEKTVTTGSAILDGTNYVQIVPSRVSGAVSYKVYRTTAGGTPSTTGLIGTIAGGAANFYLNDTGLAATTAPPSANTTGNASFGADINVSGTATVQGNLAVGATAPTNKITVNTATTADSTAQALIATGGAANKGLVIQGAPGQSADLIQWQDSGGVVRASINYNGSILKLRGNDSNSATLTTTSGQPLLIDKPNGVKLSGGLIDLQSSIVSLYNGDKSRHSMIINYSNSGGVNPLVMVGSGIGGNQSGQFLQFAVRGGTSQAYDLQQWQDYQGNALASIDKSGNLTVKTATVQGDLTVTGSAIFSGNVISFSNNVRGYNVPVPASAATQTVTFSTAYPDANYAVFCTPNYNTSCYVTNKTTTGFTLNFGTAAPAAQTVDWFVAH